MIQQTDAVRCTYCGSVSDWSAERTDATMLGEEHVCSSCGRQTSPWDEETNQNLEPSGSMSWLEADPIY
jgi:DNA-directed RNA polymerase subunit RPC12/RpoP